ncbi:MAG: hypothetical protein KF829_10070 [Ferruginibacter sp.]|nr:hypothetical protein [Ferruginibacter sp.]
MRKLSILIISTFLIAGCNNAQTNKDKNNSSSANVNSTSQNKDSKSEKESEQVRWEQLVEHKLTQNDGQVFMTMPVPKNWRFDSKQYLIYGNSNFRITALDNKFFVVRDAFPTPPNFQIRSFPSIEQLTKEDIAPAVAKKGYTIVKYESYPKAAEPNNWYDAQLYKTYRSNNVSQTIGYDLKDNNGNPAFLLLNLDHKRSDMSENWMYRLELIESDPDALEKSKKQYLFALENIHFNPKPIMDYNQREMAAIGQSWATFNERMKRNQAAFEASQRAHVNSVNAVNDAMMSSYKARSATDDKIQERELDYIYERENVADDGGNKYKVDMGYNRYWMNNQGEYMATDKYNYNPNEDPIMNNKNWKELQKIDQ